MENTEQIPVEEQNGLTLSDILYIIKKNLLLIIIILFTSGVLGFIYARVINKPTYSSTATAIVQPSEIDTDRNNYSYALALVKSFPDIIKSDIVVPLVAREVLLDRYTENTSGDTTTYTAKDGTVLDEAAFSRLVSSKAEAISKGTSVTYSDNSLILKIQYQTKKLSDYEEEEIKAETKKIPDLLIKKTKEVFDAKDENGDYIYSILADKLVQLSNPSQVKTSRGTLKFVAIAVAIGVVLSFAIILIRYLLDDTLTSKEDVERITGSNVLAFIEKAERKSGK